MIPQKISNNNRLHLFLLLACLPLVLFLSLPLAGIILRISIPEILATVFEPQSAQAVALSIETTLITTLITILAGTPLAYLMARKKFFGKTMIDALIDMPIVLPPSVAGIALLVAFGRHGILGSALSSLNIEIPFTTAAVVLAQLFVASPLYVKSAAAGFAEVDRDLEQAAAIDGASRFQIFRTVTAPLAAHTIIGGAVMTWARALGEFGATIIFAGNFPGRTQTMPLAIYMGFEIDLKIALVLSLILLVISFIILLSIKGLLRQGLKLF